MTITIVVNTIIAVAVAFTFFVRPGGVTIRPAPGQAKLLTRKTIMPTGAAKTFTSIIGTISQVITIVVKSVITVADHETFFFDNRETCLPGSIRTNLLTLDTIVRAAASVTFAIRRSAIGNPIAIVIKVVAAIICAEVRTILSLVT